MFKFILGPLGGYATGLNLITTILTTVSGMMTVVFLFTFFGNWIRDKVLIRFIRKKNRGKVKVVNPKLALIWKKYGLPGVALLTPIILTPIGGTLLAVSSGSPKDKIIFYMFISAAVWSVIFSMAIYFFGKQILPDFIKP
jgi:hypothetical protein